MNEPSRHLPFSVSLAALKGSLGFGTVAAMLGLLGSTSAGWDCPACHSPAGLKERLSGEGGRCVACSKGFDILTLVVVHRAVSASSGLAVLEEILLDEESRKAGQQKTQGGLFDG